MREVVSTVPASPTNRRLTAVFVLLALALIWVSIAFVFEVFGAADSTVLGINLALGFGLIGVMTVVYYRLFIPHRLVLEKGEDLW